MLDSAGRPILANAGVLNSADYHMMDNSILQDEIRMLDPKSAASSFRNESELMLCGARVTIDEHRAGTIMHLLQQHIDWDHLLRLIGIQGVLPLFYNNVAIRFPQTIPPITLAEMGRQCRQYVAHNLMTLDALSSVMAFFRANDIRAIPYKGPILAATVYGGSLMLRRTGDLDFMVHPREFNAAKELFLDQGYQISMDCGWKCHLTLSNYYSVLDVDLHQGFVPKWYGIEISFDQLWDRCQNVVLQGMTFPNLSSEDLLTVLCLDLAKDIAQVRNLRLIKVIDIVELLSRDPNISWDRLLDRLTRTGARGVVSLGVQTADFICGIEMPVKARKTIYAHTSLQPIVESTRKSVFSADPESVEIFRQPHLNREMFTVVKLRERLSDKIMVLFRFMKPVVLRIDKEREIIYLPPVFYFVYYLIRPIRLTTKYCIIPGARNVRAILSRVLAMRLTRN
jgi:Uncharacterised nucleotidyltransferase